MEERDSVSATAAAAARAAAVRAGGDSEGVRCMAEESESESRTLQRLDMATRRRRGRYSNARRPHALDDCVEKFRA